MTLEERMIVTGTLVLVLSPIILVTLMHARDWLYNGRGRWVGVVPPRNVVRVDFKRRTRLG